MAGKTATRKTTACRPESTRLTLEVKRALAALVEKFPEVWDLTHVNYKNRDAREASWTKIAAEMNLSAERCKAAWASLQDALRYQRTGKKGPSGKGTEEDPSQTEFNFDEIKLLEGWNLWESMKFYVLSKPSRT
ncbi:uncharacterized protein LOC118438117 [Folsomia candida]|nr:uncharacterized protein LOC118438117 [Folsomia candida]